MAPNLLFYQLLLTALVFICLLIHVWCPDASCHPSNLSLTPDKPRRKRSKEPKPFTGLIHKPLCEACEQRADGRPKAPGSPPPVITFTRGRRRTVDTRSHFCPAPDCSYPSLRWLDTQFSKQGRINRIRDVYWRHVSMAGWRRVPHRPLRESSAAGERRVFVGCRPAARSPGYFVQSSSHASGSARPAIGPGYGESSTTSADTGSLLPVPVATPTHRASHGQ